ncbi:MAG: protein kinase [Planctomycetaceae bacterium]|nr:protein kinase [Planctomycetaceae bacterium]
MAEDIPSSFDFNRFSDDIARRQAAGRPLNVEEYVAQHPDHEAEIRGAFPVLCMLSQQTADASAADNTPDQINGYRIVREIGRGGMGIVYEATHPKLTRRMAIKVLTPAQAGKSSLQERFAREAETASRLSHPHIVPLFDFGEADGQSFLVMPFIKGRGLDETLNEYWSARADSRQTGPAVGTGPAIAPVAMIADDFRRIAALGASVASALAHAHEQQTIHRDIKPANLLLDDNRKVWVTDFGLAKLRDENSDLSLTGDIIGTPRYMAPEQIRGQADERSDIYSLGVTLWELASGARAWDAVNKGDMLSVKSAFELPPVREINSSVPAGLAAIIGKCCAFQPRDRYQTADQVQQTLNRFAHEGVTTDRRFTAASMARAASSRHFLCTMLVCLLALSAVLIYSRRTRPDVAASPTPSASVKNRSPVISGPNRLSLQVVPGQTSFPNLHLTAADPDQDSFCWAARPDDSAHLFVVQKLSGHLCLQAPFRKSAHQRPDYSLTVLATDAAQPHVSVFAADSTHQILWLGESGQAWRPTTLPHGLQAIWSENGVDFQHLHTSNDGTVALYKSGFHGSQWDTKLVQPNTRLMPTVRGLTKHGNEYLSLRETRDGVVLEWLSRTADHRFERVGAAIPLPHNWSPVGISCLGLFDFQIVDRSGDQIRLAEIAVNHQQVLGLREVPAGWTAGERQVVGMAAWITERDINDAASTPVDITLTTDD